MPPPTASLRPEPVRTGGKKDKDVSSSSKTNGANNDRTPRPDQAAYNAEQDQLNKEIAQVREEMVSVESGDPGSEEEDGRKSRRGQRECQSRRAMGVDSHETM